MGDRLVMSPEGETTEGATAPSTQQAVDLGVLSAFEATGEGSTENTVLTESGPVPLTELPSTFRGESILPSVEEAQTAYESGDYMTIDEIVEITQGTAEQSHTDTATAQLAPVVNQYYETLAESGRVQEENELGQSNVLETVSESEIRPTVNINGDGLFEAAAQEENVPLDAVVTTRNVPPVEWADPYGDSIPVVAEDEEGGNNIMFIGGGALVFILIILLLIWIL